MPQCHPLTHDVPSPHHSIVPGVYFLAFYVLLWRDMRAIKVFPEYPSRRDYMRDIALSQLSIAVFGAVLVLMMLNRRFFYLEDHDPWHHGVAHVALCVVYLVGTYVNHQICETPQQNYLQQHQQLSIFLVCCSYQLVHSDA